ncbi:hypothetical protein [Oceanirhabdus sp. W0125-5]|uniref:hypothetical protein n=1 Tax=Oceanirhabdus sp. W0125-5 TaxID=2999116 RepID=UPI0022F2C5EC|nr:hypothetical protein [Oceanirhabdus sp. W0125-5]WBW96545.1 hypothetical protein OW730_23055 [Oceanirhabdus sp. W0125-5]
MSKNKKIRSVVILIGLIIGIYFLGNKIIYHMEIKKIEKQVSEYLAPKFEKFKIMVIDESVDDLKKETFVQQLKVNIVQFNPWDDKENDILKEGTADIYYSALDRNGEELYDGYVQVFLVRDNSESEFGVKWTTIKQISRDIMNKAVNCQLFKYEKVISDTKNRSSLEDKETKDNRQSSYDTCTATGSIWYEGGEVTFDSNGNVIESNTFRMIQDITGTKAVMKVVSEDDLMEFSKVKDSQGITIYIKKKAPIGNPLWNVTLEEIESIDISYSENGPKDYYKEIEVEEREKIQQIYEVVNNISVDSITSEDMNQLNYEEKKFVRVSLYLKEKGLLGFQINKNGIFFDDFIGTKSKEQGEEVLKLIEDIVGKE